MTAQSVIDNLINGNIADAKRGARRMSYMKLWDAANMAFGEGSKKAIAAVYFLKTGKGWQCFCSL
jgi:hypothetical protein